MKLKTPLRPSLPKFSNPTVPRIVAYRLFDEKSPITVQHQITDTFQDKLFKLYTNVYFFFFIVFILTLLITIWARQYMTSESSYPSDGDINNIIKQFYTQIINETEELIKKAISNIPQSAFENITQYIDLKFEQYQSDVLNKIDGLTKNLENSLQKLETQETSVNNIIKKIEETEKYNLDSRLKELSDQFKTYLHEQLELNAADRIGKVDYALSSAGGKIISVFTPDIANNEQKLNLFRFSDSKLKDALISAQEVIQPEVYPGRCWPFIGSYANLTVKLSCPIVVSHVTIDHVDSRIVRTGDSAPDHFQVFGTELDPKNHKIILSNSLLFDGNYKVDKGQIQTFPVITSEKAYQYITLVILSNHNKNNKKEETDWTCIYRFRVHSDLGCDKGNI